MNASKLPTQLKDLYLRSVRDNGIAEKELPSLPMPQQKLLERHGDGKYWLADSERRKFTVVLTGGVFDILHMGHRLTLRKAKEHGDILVVVVSTNEFVARVKGKPPIHDAEYRRTMVEELKPVDLALVGVKDRMETFKRVGPDVVVFGYDQAPMNDLTCKVVHLTEVKLDPQHEKTSSKIKAMGI